MLCERCKEREATVHITTVSPSTGDAEKHNFCETCFQQTDAPDGALNAGWTSYDPPSSHKPVVDWQKVEDILARVPDAPPVPGDEL
jgi:protein-arginine kinase activator protein McsA